jgi:hypothetical protein
MGREFKNCNITLGQFNDPPSASMLFYRNALEIFWLRGQGCLFNSSHVRLDKAVENGNAGVGTFDAPQKSFPAPPSTRPTSNMSIS